MEYAVTIGFLSMMSASRYMANTEYFLTGRGMSDGVSIRSHTHDKDLAVVTFPRGVSTWDTVEPTVSTAAHTDPSPSVAREHDDHAIADPEKDATSRDRPTKLVGFLPNLLEQRERSLGDKTAPTLAGKVLTKVWLTDPTYRINLETELLRGLRNGVSDEELSLVRGAVSGKTEREYREALQSAWERMQTRFDAYPNPTIENFDMLGTVEHLEPNSPASSAAGVSLGEFSFRWDHLLANPFQDSDSSAGDSQPPSGAGDLSDKPEDPSVANEKERSDVL